MGAIKRHKTATDTESSWDGPAEVAQAPNEAKTLRYMHAWVNDDGDPDAKSSYKFPHHAAGTDTPANIHGVNNALARLPNADIPEADRAGVETHLNAHRKDAGLDNFVHHSPIRCFEGTAQPYEPFWRWSNGAVKNGVAESGTGEPGVEAEPELEFYGYISEYSWFDDEITPKQFKNDLYRYGKGGPVTIRMNSGGGDMIAASVIRSVLLDYPGRKTVRIDGLAASAATVVALAGNAIKMQDTSFFMIHDPMVVFFLAALNIEDMSRLLDELKSAKGSLVDVYEARTGISRDRISKMMTNETWMNAHEAVDLGFADEVIAIPPQAPPTGATNAAIVNAIHNYRNVPAALRVILQPPAQPVQNNQQAAKSPR